MMMMNINQKNRRRRNRRRIPESDRNLLNDISHFPRLAAIFQAQFLICTTTNERAKNVDGFEMIAEKNGGISLSEASCSEEKSESEAGKISNNLMMMMNINQKNRRRRRKRRRIAESDVNLLNDLTHFPHLTAIFQAQFLICTTPKENAKNYAQEITLPEASNQKKRRRRNRRGISEADRNLLNDLTHFPHLAAIFQAQLKRVKNVDGFEMVVEKNGGISLPEEAIKNQKRRRRRIAEADLKLLNDLTHFPNLAAIFQAQFLICTTPNERENINVSKTTAEKNGGITRPEEATGHSHTDNQQEKSGPAEHGASREDCIGGTYELLQMRKDADALEVIDCPPFSPGHVTTDFSNSGNIVELICHSSADLVSQSLEEKSTSVEIDASKEDFVGGTYEAVQMRDTFEMVDRRSSSPRCVATDFSNSGNIEGHSVTEDQQEKSNPDEHVLEFSREDSVEGSFEMLESRKDAYTLEETDCFSSSPGHLTAVISSPRNIGERTSPSAELVSEDLQEKSNSDDRTTEDVLSALLPLAEDMLPMKLLVDIADQDACKEVSQSVSTWSKSAITEENLVLRKLLRKWRYFDSGNETFSLEGHAVKSASKNQRKRCYVCGDAQHTGKRCRKRRACYFCHERGHLVEDCPKSSQEFNICLRCGESGHDLYSCTNGYPPDDLKNIVCYVCNKVGHLCCISYTNINPDTVSCYNCGESGHSGMQCPKPHMDKKKTTQPPLICNKCGEEGHAARKCGVISQNKRQQTQDIEWR